MSLGIAEMAERADVRGRVFFNPGKTGAPGSSERSQPRNSAISAISKDGVAGSVPVVPRFPQFQSPARRFSVPGKIRPEPLGKSCRLV